VQPERATPVAATGALQDTGDDATGR
jgi:hypothetical protein